MSPVSGGLQGPFQPLLVHVGELAMVNGTLAGQIPGCETVGPNANAMGARRRKQSNVKT